MLFLLRFQLMLDQLTATDENRCFHRMHARRVSEKIEDGDVREQ